MTNATRVRKTSWRRQPALMPQWTFGGEKQPTALAIAGAGKLADIARRMGKRGDTLQKWAQGERGPERDLAALFPALKASGVSLQQSLLIANHVYVLCRSAYGDELPDLEELQDEETLKDGTEDVFQRAFNRTQSLASKVDLKLAWEELAALLLSGAAVLEREIQEEGVV